MNKKNKSLLKAILPWVLVLVIIGSIIPVLTNRNAGNETLTYSEFTKALEDEKIKEVTVKPQSYVVDVTGKYTKKVDGKNKTVSFSTLVPATDEEVDSLMQVIKDQGVKAKVADASDDNMVINIIMNLIPYIILIGGMVFLFKYMNAAGGGNAKAFEFGNSRAKLEKNEKTRFSDVAGADEEKEEVKELVDFLKNPKRFADMGAKIPRGVLLSEFVEMFVGVGAGRVRDMFKTAKQNAPCIIFIDEIDAVGRQRGTGVGGGHDEREQTLNQLLVEMDGFEGNEGVIVLAATNRADVLDPALLRPGRFDRQIHVSNPDRRARAQILAVHARNKKLAPDVDFDNIARRTPGFSGAQLANVLNEAALLAVRLGHSVITLEDVDEAIDRVIGGPAKKSRKYTEKERKLVAYHESGHAIVGLTLEDANQVQKVTIVPRGDAGGYNLMTPKDETYFETKQQLLAEIAGFMGGRVAEEILIHIQVRLHLKLISRLERLLMMPIRKQLISSMPIKTSLKQLRMLYLNMKH